MLSYVKLFYSFNSETSALTDAEVGRLVRQLLAFGERGDTQRYLRGNERLLFPVYRAQLERDGEKYAALSQTRAESGRAGGKARQRMAKSGKSGHDKDKDKAQEEEKEKEKGKGAAAVSARDGGDGSRNCNSSDSEPRPEPENFGSEDFGDWDSVCESDYDSDWDGDSDCGCESDCELNCDCDGDSVCDSVSDFEDSDEWIDVTAAFRSDGCEPHRAIEQILRRKYRNSANAADEGNSECKSADSTDDEKDFDCDSADSADDERDFDCKSARSAGDERDFDCDSTRSADDERDFGGKSAKSALGDANSGSEKYIDPIAQYVFENLGTLSAGNLAELEAFEEVLSEAAIRFAVDQACANGVRKWAYARKILNAWRDQGIHTLAEAQAEANRKAAGSNPSSGYGNPNSGYGGANSGYGGSNSGYGGSNSGYSFGYGYSNPALNYDQRTYTESDFADLFIDLSAPLPSES